MRHSRLLIGGGLIALMLLAPHVGLTQPSIDEFNKLRFENLQKDVESLKAGQKAIIDELQEMTKLLSSRGEARGDDRSPIRGIKNTLSGADACSKRDKTATLTPVDCTDYH